MTERALMNFSARTYTSTCAGDVEEKYKQQKLNDLREFARLFTENLQEPSRVNGISFWGCFASFMDGGNLVARGNQFYWFFPFLYPWWSDILEEINDTATNFRVTAEVVKENWAEHKVVRSWTGDYSDIFISTDKTSEQQIPIYGVIFNVTPLGKWSDHALQALTYIIHHTFRFCSLPEKQYFKLTDKKPIDKTWLDYLLELNTTRYTEADHRGEYRVRCLCERDLSKENYFLIDYPKLMARTRGKQTPIFDYLWKHWTRKFPQVTGDWETIPGVHQLVLVKNYRSELTYAYSTGDNGQHLGIFLLDSRGVRDFSFLLDYKKQGIEIERIPKIEDEDFGEICKEMRKRTNAYQREALRIASTEYGLVNLGVYMQDYEEE